jgi:hypothetical protein
MVMQNRALALLTHLISTSTRIKLTAPKTTTVPLPTAAAVVYAAWPFPKGFR